MTIHDGSLADRVVNHLRRHPEAKLTACEIASLFSYRRNKVHERMRPALKEGLAELAGDKRPHVYQLKR